MATRTEGYRERLNQIEMNGLKFASPTQDVEAEGNLEEPKKREQDMNNPGRDAFDAKHDGNPNAVTGMPLASPHPIDIPVPENQVNVRINLDDAVDFISRWEKAKPEEMRPAFAEAHLRGIAMDRYLTELKTRTEVAQQLGQSQILLPTIPQAIYTGEAKTASREDDDYMKKMMATLAPFAATQKLFGMGDDDKQTEKPTEIARTIMDMGKDMAEMNKNKDEQPKITEVIDSIVTVAEKLNPNSGKNSKMDDITSIVELAKSFADMKEDATKIQVPNPDGTFTEMPASQYLLSQLLATKNETPNTENANNQPDTITITNPDGNTKKMPVAVYMAEQMLNKGKDNQGDNGGRDEPPNSKLLATLVGTVEQLSNNMNEMRRRLAEQSNPLEMMKRLRQESDEWNTFREGFMGSAGTTQSEREAEEEKKRDHELEIKRIDARKESSMALASIMNKPQPAPNAVVVPEDTGADFQRSMDERLLSSQQKAKAFSNFHTQPQVQVSEIENDKGGEKRKHGRK